ncbi:MAG: hypothetical protein ACREJD_07775 [Phycisphaerales bacterium]
MLKAAIILDTVVLCIVLIGVIEGIAYGKTITYNDFALPLLSVAVLLGLLRGLRRRGGS